MADFPLPSNIGSFKIVTGADPGANTESSDAVPAGKSWLLISVKLTLVQGATQTPQPILQIDGGAATPVYFEAFGSSAAQAVSTTCVYTFGTNMPLSGQVGAAAGVHSTAPLADDLLLGSGHRIKTSTLGIGANSDYGAPIYYVCELG